MLSMTMIFTPEQQIFMTEPYFSNGDTLHTFRESARPKVCTEENIDCQTWKTNPNYLSGNCRSRLSYQCQFVKGLFERILKIQ
jgi:hypothetical protein